MFGRHGLELRFSLPFAVPGKQALDVVAVGSVGGETVLIKQAFDAAAQANLVGVVLSANRPTHLSMPAAS